MEKTGLINPTEHSHPQNKKSFCSLWTLLFGGLFLGLLMTFLFSPKALSNASCNQSGTK
jgi:hypothetical protein